MTTTWIIVNIALAALVTALVAGVAVLVPVRLDRGPASRAARTGATAAPRRGEGVEQRLAA
jgi:hypothetical protein